MDTLTYYELALLRLRHGGLTPQQEEAMERARDAMYGHAAAVDAAAVAAAVEGLERRMQGASINPLHDKSAKDV